MSKQLQSPKLEDILSSAFSAPAKPKKKAAKPRVAIAKAEKPKAPRKPKAKGDKIYIVNTANNDAPLVAYATAEGAQRRRLAEAFKVGGVAALGDKNHFKLFECPFENE